MVNPLRTSRSLKDPRSEALAASVAVGTCPLSWLRPGRCPHGVLSQLDQSSLVELSVGHRREVAGDRDAALASPASPWTRGSS